MSRSLREFMNPKPRDPHYYIADARDYVFCVDGKFHPRALVGSDGGGVMPRTWKTQRGAYAFADKLGTSLVVRFSEFAP